MHCYDYYMKKDTASFTYEKRCEIECVTEGDIKGHCHRNVDHVQHVQEVNQGSSAGDFTKGERIYDC